MCHGKITSRDDEDRCSMCERKLVVFSMTNNTADFVALKRLRKFDTTIAMGLPPLWGLPIRRCRTGRRGKGEVAEVMDTRIEGTAELFYRANGTSGWIRIGQTTAMNQSEAETDTSAVLDRFEKESGRVPLNRHERRKRKALKK